MKISTQVWLVTFFGILLSGAMVTPVLAERLESDSYVIQFGNFNITAGEKSSASYTVTDTVGQTGAGPYGEYGVSGYFVGGGFQYIYQIDEFFFQISKLQIDLGTLSPGVHNTDSHTLSVSTRNGGYKVYAFEEHQLRHRTGLDEIDDTTCDAGGCDETAAALWQNVNIPGFGFNISGDDIPIDFVTTNYFRQFANSATPESMQIVMSADNNSINRVSTLTYKAGVAGDQAAGIYDTAVVFVAVPSY